MYNNNFFENDKEMIISIYLKLKIEIFLLNN